MRRKQTCVALALAIMPAMALAEPQAANSSATVTTVIACSSQADGRQHCSANTSAGVVLVKSTGPAACLLGKSWGYDDQGVWVQEGCGGEFMVAGTAPASVAEQPGTSAQGELPLSTSNKSQAQSEPAVPADEATAKPKHFGSYQPNVGFKVAETSFGSVNLKLFTYVRYLNQKALDRSYTNFFGRTTPVQQREDVQVNKVILSTLGWFIKPKLSYLAYVWSTNTSQGLGAQVVVAGNATYQFNDHFTLGGGIRSLPGTRSLEGNFPYWLGVDDRNLADEFFRPSYTTGVWVNGEIVKGLDYNVMVGNNMSQLGVSALELNNSLDTLSASLVWMPTTGEFGPFAEFGDFADHQKVATRFGAHFSRSDENRQSQPNTDSFDNVQIRLSDGSVIFTPELFGPGITVTDVQYHMVDLDAGIKYRGFSFAAEYYHRWLNSFSGPGTAGLPQINDNGFQLQTSAMLRPKFIQAYAAGSAIFGAFGDPWDARVGINVYPWRNRMVRCNFEYIQLYRSPVGSASLPYPVGGNGPAFNINFVLSF